jgi:hypothetical protein
VPHVDVGVFDKGGEGRTPPSAAIRVHRRLRNVASDRLAAERLDASAYASGTSRPRDVALVIRDAISPQDVEEFLSRVRRDGARLVLDLDDDLLTATARRRLVRQEYDGERLAALAEVVRRADAVMVSTRVLADRVSSSATCPVEVVENELDPLLWSSVQPAEPAPDDGRTRLLYFGSRTHTADLARLEGLPAALGERLGREVLVETVGVVGRDASLPPGFTPVEATHQHYPGFVRWLRRNRARWAVGLAPLADEPFNESKSDLKLLEYAGLGLPAVASPVGPYRDAPAALARRAVGLADWVEQVAACLAGPDSSSARQALVRSRTMSPTTLERWTRLVSGQPWSRPSR